MKQYSDEDKETFKIEMKQVFNEYDINTPANQSKL